MATGWYKNAAGQMVNGPMPANVYRDNSVDGSGGWVEGINPSPPGTAAAYRNPASGLTLGGNGSVPGVSTAVQPGQTQWNQTGQYWTDPTVPTGHAVPQQNLYPGVEQKYDQAALDYFYMLNNPGWKPGAPTAPPTGLIGSEQALERGLSNASSAVYGGAQAAAETLSPYNQAGTSAIKLQADLSGANGPEAQQAAFAQYNESPEVAYQREQAEKSVMRNASATGGLQSSPVLQELQRQAVGLAQQDYGNYYNRIGDVANIGAGTSTALGNIQGDAGKAVGDYNYGTGIATSEGRTNAGNAIAGNVADTTSQLSALVAAQGGDLANIMNTSGSDLANLLTAFGTADAQTMQTLATLLANISTGSGSQVAGLQLTPAETGIMNDLAALFEGVGTAAAGFKGP